MTELQVAKKSGELVIRVDLSNRHKLTIGRSSRCDMILTSGSISRHHALMFEEYGRWVIIDTGSRTGLWTAEGRVQTAEFSEDRWVRLGPAFLWTNSLPKSPSTPPPLLDSELGRVVLRSEYLEALANER